MTNTDIKSIFGRRLAQARRMRGLSLRTLADQLKPAVSHNALHKYEQGVMMPDSTVLQSLCRLLGQKQEFFFRDFTVSLASVEFRKKTALGAREVTALREEAADFFERYLEVEQALGLEVDFQHPLPDFTVRKPADVEEAAVKLRGKWRLGLDPLGNVVELLERHRIKVFAVDAPEEFDGFAGWTGKIPVVALNTRFPADRRRLTALHELGHLLLTFDGKRFDAKAIEKLCHRFAGAMLMPEPVFTRELGGHRTSFTVQELVDIKADYGISIAAIMARARDLGLISDGDYTRFCIRRNQLGWAKTEPGIYQGEEPSNRFQQLLHRAVATEAVSMTLAASLAKQPLAEFQKGLRFVP